MPAPAVIADYDTQWPVRADRLLQDVRLALRPLPDSDRFAFDHIGSTAVPGLAAKPIIDLQVQMPSLPQREELADRLAPAGFRVATGSRPDSPGVYRDTPRPGSQAPEHVYEKRLFHSPQHEAILHIRRLDSPFAAFVVLFRDWLQEHPDEARRYEQHKRSLADAHAADPDYDDYTRGKSDFLAEAESRMRAWAGMAQRR